MYNKSNNKQYKFRAKCIGDLKLKRLLKQFNPLSAGDAFKRIHTVFPQLKFDRN